MFFTLLFFVLIGCAQVLSHEEIKQKWLNFLEDGNTKKIEILSRLGKPRAQFQGGRTLTYRLQLDHQGFLRPASQMAEVRPLDNEFWAVTDIYDLTLIFDEREILKQHSLVLIK